jgi:hypothetical protein
MKFQVHIFLALFLFLTSPCDVLSKNASSSSTSASIQKADASQQAHPFDTFSFFALHNSSEREGISEKSQQEIVPLEHSKNHPAASSTRDSLQNGEKGYLKLSESYEISQSVKVLIFPFHTHL